MTTEALKIIAAKHKVAEDRIPAILNALIIKTDKPSEAQLRGVERVCELMKGGAQLEAAAETVANEAKAKTTAKDNPESAQNVTVTEREQQLKDIALRYSMGDRIPEVVVALKLKPEIMTPEQFEQFRDVCDQVQQGLELPMVAQGVLNKAKAAKAKTTGPERSQQPEPAGAIAKSDHQLSEVIEQPIHEDQIPPSFVEHLNYLAEAVVSTDKIDSIDLDERVANRAIRVEKMLDGAIDQAIWGAIIKKNTQGGLNADRTLEILKRKRMEQDAG
jgi:hypothetical protein